MAMVYRYRAGYNFRGVKADVVGATVAAIMEANGGQLTPADVVEDARPEDAPLHPCFTWDDAEAAEKYREDEARRVIRSYVVVKTDAAGNEKEEIANVSVASPYDDEGPAYMPAMSAMEDPARRARIIAFARAQLDGWHARYGHIEELAEAAELVRQAKAAATAPRPAPRRRAGDRRRDAARQPALN